MHQRQLQAEGAAVVHIAIGIWLGCFAVVEPDRFNVPVGQPHDRLAIEAVHHIAEQAPAAAVVEVQIQFNIFALRDQVKLNRGEVGGEFGVDLDGFGLGQAVVEIAVNSGFFVVLLVAQAEAIGGGHRALEITGRAHCDDALHGSNPFIQRLGISQGIGHALGHAVIHHQAEQAAQLLIAQAGVLPLEGIAKGVAGRGVEELGIGEKQIHPARGDQAGAGHTDPIDAIDQLIAEFVEQGFVVAHAGAADQAAQIEWFDLQIQQPGIAAIGFVEAGKAHVVERAAGQ